MRPQAELGEYKGLEVGRAETEVPDEAVEAELDRLREGFASLAPVERAGGRRATRCVIDFAGTIDGEPFEGSESRDFVIELGAESLLPEFDAALTGAGGGRRAHGRGHLPRRPPARGPRRQDRELRGHGQGGAREEPARARRRLRRRGLGVRHRSTSCATRSARGCREGARAARRGRVPRGGGRRGRREREARDPARHRPRPRARDVGADRAPARRARDRPADLRPDAGQGPPRPDRRRRGGRRARAAPRGGARRGRRRRGDRADRRGPARGARARARARTTPEKLLERLRE